MTPRLRQEMVESGLPASFVDRVSELAETSEPFADLVEMWAAVLVEERDSVTTALQELVEDHEPHGPPLRVASAAEADEELISSRRRAG